MAQRTVYREITSPAQFLGLKEQGLVNFGAGQPDLSPPELPAVDAACYGYGPIRGEPSLVAGISRMHGVDHCIVTSGASEALHLAIWSCVQPGDNVVLPVPYYYSYHALTRFHHCTPVCTTLDPDRLREACRDASALILNSPANPSGRVVDPETIQAVADICAETDTWLIFDEVYERLTYAKPHYSPRGEHVININSFSKTFSMCGFRVGYAYSENEDVIERMVQRKTHCSMNTSRLGQQLAEHVLEVPESFHEERLKTWRTRRDYMVKRLRELNLNFVDPEGAFYVLVELPDSAVEPLFYEHKLITYKGKWFGAPHHLRLSYATELDRLEEGMDRLERWLRSGGTPSS